MFACVYPVLYIAVQLQETDPRDFFQDDDVPFKFQKLFKIKYLVVVESLYVASA